MKRIRKYLVVLIAVITGISANAQELWLSANGRANITKALRADIELEHRSRDGFDATSRWSAEAALSYKCLPWLRAGVAYKFLYNRDGGKSTKKGNYIPAYWQTGHRIQVMATGSWDIGKFEFSIREAYHFTSYPGQSVDKYSATGVQKDDEIVDDETRHQLRSRAQVEYKHKKKCLLTPFVSFEIYNDLAGGFASTRKRYTGGTDIRIDKHNSMSVFYRFIDRTSGRNNHVIGVGYTFKL